MVRPSAGPLRRPAWPPYSHRFPVCNVQARCRVRISLRALLHAVLRLLRLVRPHPWGGTARPRPPAARPPRAETTDRRVIVFPRCGRRPISASVRRGGTRSRRLPVRGAAPRLLLGDTLGFVEQRGCGEEERQGRHRERRLRGVRHVWASRGRFIGAVEVCVTRL